MEDFLRKFSSIPSKFISDFYTIANEDYSENEISIDFVVVCKWLKVRKDHLKRLLISKFDENYDYVIEKATKKHKNANGSAPIEKIMITPNCFKELCMISQTAKAKEVRKYFIEMEKLVKRYHEQIQENMYKEIGLLKYNQKPKSKIKGGVLYVLRALNTDTTLYKLGKTKDLKNRLKTYNSGNANDVEPEFIISVKDIDATEACVKGLLKSLDIVNTKKCMILIYRFLKK